MQSSAKRFIFSLFVLLSVGLPDGYSDDSATPAWVKEYMAHPPEAWTEWRNVLKPEGDGVALHFAEEGVARFTIVIPAQPTAQEAKAAQELAFWLKEITGADFPIVDDTTQKNNRELSVGNTNP